MTRAFWACFALSMALYAMMLFWTLPQIKAEAGGLLPFDLRPLGYTEEAARRYLNALSARGRDVYLGPQHLLDLFYPITLAAVFVLGAMILYRGRVLWVIIGFAMVGEIADYGENTLVSTMLTSHPNLVPSSTIAFAGFLTFAKSVAVMICICALVFGAARVWISRRRLQRGLKRFGYMSLDPRDGEYDPPETPAQSAAPAPFKSRRKDPMRAMAPEAGE